MLRKVIATALVVSTLTCGVAQARDQTGAILGGLAVGAVGGAILGSALSQSRPAPTVYYAAPPQRVVVVDPFEDRLSNLHADCDAGDRHACIRFGILIGQHQERVADWHRSHPDYFNY